MRTVQVSLGSRGYSILIGPGLLAGIGKHCARLKLGRKCAIITDSNVGPRYADPVVESLRGAGFDPVVVTVPAGERTKCFRQVESCCDRLAGHRMERSSFVIALGGGVVGDLAGFVAASFLRGVAFVQAPTSLLAQVDSSVGGKVGVNLKSGKNLAGAFYQPRLVLCDLDTLTSLPDREYRSGIAEVIKYGIIQDPALFTLLEKKMPLLLRKDEGLLGRVVARSCEIKAEVVSQDETEGGLRAILNYGHTVGHAIENVFGYSKFLHGEAISYGQVAAASLSSELTGLTAAEWERIRALFVAAGLPVQIQLNTAQRAKILAAMQLDKKVSGGEVKFVLATNIGAVRFGEKVPLALVERILANPELRLAKA